MARQLSRIRQGNWHSADCKLCGGKIEQDKVETYRAIRTLPNQECLEDEVPILEEVRVGRIRIGTIRSSRVRFLGTLPRLYLFHRRCYAMIRHAAGCEKSKVSALTLVSILASTAPVDNSNFEPLSNLDGNTFTTIFNSRPTIQSDTPPPSPLSTFRERLYDSPSEVVSLVLSHCQAEYALAITVGLADSFFNQAIRNNIARQRITVGIQAARLLRDRAHEEVYIEKNIKLSANMTAVFLPLGGETYLQNIEETNSCQKSSEYRIDFSLEAGSQVLALQVDHLGIRNIAFELGKDKKPIWLRDENRLANIFFDKFTTGSFDYLRTVSDVSKSLSEIHNLQRLFPKPIKIRMIDIATPNRSNNPHPRALLPRHLGIGVPYSVKTVRAPYLLIEGYFEPSYIEFSACKSVYLSSKANVGNGGIFVGIGGIYNRSGDGREEVSLGSRSEKRTVRMFGLQKLSFPGGSGAFLQVRYY